MGKAKQDTVKFIYQKNPLYKTYTAEGVVGGITPKGKIFFDLFNEKFPFPKSALHEISQEGTLGKEVSRDSEEAIIREVECGIYLDIDVAIVLSDWLNIKINEFKEKSGQE